MRMRSRIYFFGGVTVIKLIIEVYFRPLLLFLTEDLVLIVLHTQKFSVKVKGFWLDKVIDFDL